MRAQADQHAGQTRDGGGNAVRVARRDHAPEVVAFDVEVRCEVPFDRRGRRTDGDQLMADAVDR
jgi:hypothetical protein